MASHFRTTFTLLLLLVVSQSCHLSIASFCSHSLSRPTCPDLPTYDAFDITTYGGRWFEIGSSANFKNLQESGGICVLANYSLLQAPSPDKGAEVGVVNTLYGLGAPTHNVSQVVISLSAGEICSRAFSICAQTDLKNNSIAQGLALISYVGWRYPLLADSLDCTADGIEDAVAKINEDLDSLSQDVSRIQILTAKLGQLQGNATKNYANLLAVLAEANATAIAIAEQVDIINKERQIIQSVAWKARHSAATKLDEAARLISAGEDAILAQLGQIKGSLEAMEGTSPLFLVPSFGAQGYNSRIVGTAVQNATFAGKLEVTFPGFPPGKYWILAVDNSTSDDGGYDATLVYGCDNSPGGGIEETLFVLSRTSTLPILTVKSLLAKGAALGVTGDCSTPFILTVQNESCGNPPSDFPPSH